MNQTNSLPFLPAPRPLLFVLSGLSGSGKDAVLDGLRRSGCPLEFIVTVTSRPKRAGEQDGVHYQFVSPVRFQELIQRQELLEWACVYGNWYGVPAEPVRQALAAGMDVMIKVDVQGAATLKRLMPDSIFIFLTAPSLEELAKRLRQRGSDSLADIQLRLETARKELEQLGMFDYIVISREGQVDRAVADVKAIITAEKCRLRH